MIQRDSMIDYNPADTSFIDLFDKEFAQTFKPIESVFDFGLNDDDVYVSTQDLHICTDLNGGAKRLLATTKGKENFHTNFTTEVEFDFRSSNSLNKSIENMLDDLVDLKSPLMLTIQGDNWGNTDDLQDAVGMSPPIISLFKPINPTIFCDDPEIDPYYNDDEQADKMMDVLKKYLTPIKIEQSYRSCRGFFDYIDLPECEEDEEICGATLCKFTRFIYDDCGQKSNELIEKIRILPRKPTFRNFPENFATECNENMNVTENESRFVIPFPINTGCRGVYASIRYEDELVRGTKCTHTVYRTWIAERDGCENTLFSVRSQRIFIEDKQPPRFSEFPSDKVLGFFQSFGPEHTGTPKIFDGCGHGPSKLTYSDK